MLTCCLIVSCVLHALTLVASRPYNALHGIRDSLNLLGTTWPAEYVTEAAVKNKDGSAAAWYARKLQAEDTDQLPEAHRLAIAKRIQRAQARNAEMERQRIYQDLTEKQGAEMAKKLAEAETEQILKSLEATYQEEGSAGLKDLEVSDFPDDDYFVGDNLINSPYSDDEEDYNHDEDTEYDGLLELNFPEEFEEMADLTAQHLRGLPQQQQHVQEASATVPPIITANESSYTSTTTMKMELPSSGSEKQQGSSGVSGPSHGVVHPRHNESAGRTHERISNEVLERVENELDLFDEEYEGEEEEEDYEDLMGYSEADYELELIDLSLGDPQSKNLESEGIYQQRKTSVSTPQPVAGTSMKASEAGTLEPSNHTESTSHPTSALSLSSNQTSSNISSIASQQPEELQPSESKKQERTHERISNEVLERLENELDMFDEGYEGEEEEEEDDYEDLMGYSEADYELELIDLSLGNQSGKPDLGVVPNDPQSKNLEDGGRDQRRKASVTAPQPAAGTTIRDVTGTLLEPSNHTESSSHPSSALSLSSNQASSNISSIAPQQLGVNDSFLSSSTSPERQAGVISINALSSSSLSVNRSLVSALSNKGGPDSTADDGGSKRGESKVGPLGSHESAGLENVVASDVVGGPEFEASKGIKAYEVALALVGLLGMAVIVWAALTFGRVLLNSLSTLEGEEHVSRRNRMISTISDGGLQKPETQDSGQLRSSTHITLELGGAHKHQGDRKRGKWYHEFDDWEQGTGEK
ncbi:hypothetical protein CEUSTIGMA_g1544.t1 [Chlamydomonas eustigma]|uniref:Uncharacterized protein n=1 Tax=Chlamydomonas eustigma TaxID=1157962 RepID=A0A250WTD4_9CHLO|nr:hypothetical protein CEUSTIGMA_g1544.t1 [Chlamydomonas eustigma]|eukprot:GAX74094.1 hypothetical protein CEUSTIGMA_g1544.t1 [Chlamydomonas eustigma]